MFGKIFEFSIVRSRILVLFLLIKVQTVQALPPSRDLPYGRCNTVLVTGDNGDQTFSVNGGTYLKLCFLAAADAWSGCHVIQIRLIFQPAMSNRVYPCLIYGEFFWFAENTAVDDNGVEVYVPTPGIDMFLVHRHMRSGGRTRMADIVQLDTVLQVVDLVPKHGRHAEA